jgi:hypothetical protein
MTNVGPRGPRDRSPAQSVHAGRRISYLRATRQYDGRRVTIRESRGGWKYEACLSGYHPSRPPVVPG